MREWTCLPCRFDSRRGLALLGLVRAPGPNGSAAQGWSVGSAPSYASPMAGRRPTWAETKEALKAYIPDIAERPSVPRSAFRGDQALREREHVLSLISPSGVREGTAAEALSSLMSIYPLGRADFEAKQRMLALVLQPQASTDKLPDATDRALNPTAHRLGLAERDPLHGAEVQAHQAVALDLVHEGVHGRAAKLRQQINRLLVTWESCARTDGFPMPTGLTGRKGGKLLFAYECLMRNLGPEEAAVVEQLAVTAGAEPIGETPLWHENRKESRRSWQRAYGQLLLADEGEQSELLVGSPRTGNPAAPSFVVGVPPRKELDMETDTNTPVEPMRSPLNWKQEAALALLRPLAGNALRTPWKREAQQLARRLGIGVRQLQAFARDPSSLGEAETAEIVNGLGIDDSYDTGLSLARVAETRWGRLVRDAGIERDWLILAAEVDDRLGRIEGAWIQEATEDGDIEAIEANEGILVTFTGLLAFVDEVAEQVACPELERVLSGLIDARADELRRWTR